jgi:predicted component of type VI protein secretion system
VIIIGCNDNYRKKTPSELKIELQIQENENPMQYMKLENVLMSKNKIKDAGLFSSAKYDGYLITGQASNTATMAKYKDLQIIVEFYSKTKTTIDNKTYVLYEFYQPSSTKEFSIKIDAPKAMESFGIFVGGAVPSY